MPRIKIYLLTDMEGVSGLGSAEMMDEEYRRCCELLMHDTNAAVDGAFAGGADEVYVLDGHGGGENFIDSMLDTRATKCPKGIWWGCLDETFSGMYVIGAHAMAGTQNAFLDHTQSSVSWYEYLINGRPSGELAQWATVAGHWNIPMLMVSGDEAACIEARRFFDPLEVAVTKRGIGRNTAELVPAEESHGRIRETAKRAVSLIGKGRPYRPLLPMEVIIRFTRSDYCDAATVKPGNERIDARTIRKYVESPLDIFP